MDDKAKIVTLCFNYLGDRLQVTSNPFYFESHI